MTTRSVLLVDACPDDASTVVAALTESGQFVVEWVEHLTAATSALARESYDCLMVDLGSPDARGLGAVRTLRALAPRASLVVLTGDDDECSALAAIKAGIDDYLFKDELSSRGLLRSVRFAIERAKLRNALMLAEQSARSLSAIVESTADAVFAKSADGLITTWNRGAEELYGYSARDVIGRHVSLLHPDGEDESASIFSTITHGGTIRGLETVRRSQDGNLVNVSLTVSPLHGPDGELLGASVIARDIGDRVLLEAQLKKQAMHDALTGLPNRALLTDRLSQALGESIRSGRPVAVLFLDLDHFKQVNDAEGHLAGDQLLVQIALRLSAAVRPADTVARLGGDEFVIICPGTDTSEAEGLAERMALAVSQPVHIHAQVVHMTASIGIAVVPPLEPNAESLLRHADAAMYEAKARGRARRQIFDVSFAEGTRQKLALAHDLRSALADDGLDVHYQPVIDISTGDLVGVEALTRWNHPTRGWVPPSMFVPLAEETGFVNELDRWVLRRACQDAVVIRGADPRHADVRMSVNLSARTLSDPGLAAVVRRIAATARLAPEALVLEVTETALMNDTVTARRTLEALRRLGTGVALDDFGTGYSSLSLLRQLPVTELKIDRSFIHNIAGRANDLAIASSIVDLSRALGIQTVAEGVETAAQLKLLRDLGCQMAQGYLWSRAVPLAELVGHRSAWTGGAVSGVAGALRRSRKKAPSAPANAAKTATE